MTKTIQPKNDEPLPSTVRMRRRNGLLNALAEIMAENMATTRGKKVKTWVGFSTLFSEAIFPDELTAANLSKREVKSKIVKLLKGFLKNVNAMSEDGTVEALAEVLKATPRKKKNNRKRGEPLSTQ